eukprot:1543962-Prymnesium_polylepis.1
MFTFMCTFKTPRKSNPVNQPNGFIFAHEGAVGATSSENGFDAATPAPAVIVRTIGAWPTSSN